MTRIAERTRPVRFETDSTFRERGHHRAILVECSPRFVTVRLKGTRSRYHVEWDAVMSLALKQAAAAARREKLAAKDAKKKGGN